MAFLIVEERGARRHVPLLGRRTTIGRAPDNDVVLEDTRSSRHHAVVEYMDEGYRLRDLDSLNGVFAGGLRVRDHPLAMSETFTIGEARLTLESEHAAAFETQVGHSVPDESSGERREFGKTAPSLPSLRSAPPVEQTRRDASLTPRSAGLAAPPLSERLSHALREFQPGAGAFTPGQPLRSFCAFAARLLPGNRVCVALAGSAPTIVAAANFLTTMPESELTPVFAKRGEGALKLGDVVFHEAGDVPAQAYVPARTPEGKPAWLFFERESRLSDFESDERILIAALGALAATLLGARELTEGQSQTKARVQLLEKRLVELEGELRQRIEMQTAELSRAREGSASIPVEPVFRYDYSSIVGKSAPMREMFRLLDRVTDLPVPVLVVGESGSGKELVARALHFNSARARQGQFVAENCAALPEALLESELFGHKRGAFTGAERDKVGLFEMADGGTILLDEIGETTPALQAKLLRVIEEGEVRPVGGDRAKKVNFRLVAATNRSLEEMVKAGSFRQDLFYRINVITVRVPPLRERRDDIPFLVEYFLNQCAEERGLKKIRASSGALRAFMEYNWPGNVRELENEVKRMVALIDGDKITDEHLSPALRGVAGSVLALDAAEDMPLKALVEAIEKRRIEEVMAKAGGNKSRTAEMLGLSRVGLRKKMERYGLE